jgi:hypothetical protein
MYYFLEMTLKNREKTGFWREEGSRRGGECACVYGRRKESEAIFKK